MTEVPRRTVDEMLAQARARYVRRSPEESFADQRRGALLVDIRPQVNRDLEGQIPGALVVDRNVLEWRFDPQCEARLPVAAYDLEVVLFCNEGYTSSLAAATLLDLGIGRATDMDGGFRAWQAAGLPIVEPEAG